MPEEMKYSGRQIEKLIFGIFDGSISEYDIPKDLYLATADYLKKGLYKGFGMNLEQAIDIGGKDLQLLTELRESIYLFSAAKNFTELKEMSALLTDGENVRSFKEFKDAAMKVYDIHNLDYLKTEYNTAIAQGTMADKWLKIEDQKEFLPYLQYSAIGDACAICKPLDGIIAKVNDPIWSSIYPTNHFNCFKKGTSILTPGGWVNIEEIKKGGLVIGGSGNMQYVTGVHVKDFEGKLFNIGIKNNSISSTENHGILTVNGWKRADNLAINDILIQSFKGSFFDKIINTINNLYTVLAHLFMSVKTKRKSAMTNTLNTGFKIRQININKTAVYQFISNCVNSFRYKKIKNYLLTFRKFFMVNTVSFRIFIIRFNSLIVSLFTNTQIKHRVVYSHPFRGIRPGASESRVKMFPYLFKFIRGINFSLIGINPLKFHGLCFASEFKPIFNKKPYKRPVINFKNIANFCSVKKLSKISFINGFTAGQPLSRFNSLFDFKLHSFFHRKFVLIKNIDIVDYSGQIYNLSVNIDETYITNVCVVHNCICVVLQLDEGTPTAGRAGIVAGVEDKMQPLFINNVGKTGEVFTKDHPYFSEAPKKLGKENFGMPIPENDD